MGSTAGAEIEADVDKAWLFPEELEQHRFGELPPLSEVPTADALALPAADDSPCGDVVGTKVVTPKFKVSNLGRTLSYSWDKVDFPWLCLWTEHKSRTGLPWDGVERTRGLEFSTKPFPEGKPPPERAEEFDGVPTTCLIPAAGRSTEVKLSWS